MSDLRRKYPGDTNAALFYALGLVWTAGPGQDGIAQRRKALDILLPIFRAHPNNPGAAHYIIHAADTPELAAIALPAARKYAAIAPDSPHALHMPSHIFSRLGYWHEMIRSNEDSARVAADWVREGRDGRFDELHALKYLEYGYLQLDERRKAREQIGRIAELMKVPGGDHWAQIDARILFDVQTSDWLDARKTAAPVGSPVRENFDVYWVHTVAAAHAGDLREARSSLRELADSIRQQKSVGYANTLHVYWLQAQSAVEAAEGEREEAVATLKNAVAFEQTHPVDYPNVLPPPSAECLGMLWLDMRRPAEAAAAFRQALTMAPNTWQPLMGASRAAAMLTGRSAAN
jgi:tetratricopeptide (TPR) repeat protein